MNKFIPRIISWGVTNKCNLKCKHCYRGAGSELPNELTIEEGKTLMGDLASLNGKLLVLSGGEPLLRKDIFELASYGASLGLTMLLASNGALITREVARKIRDSGVKIVAISLDGATPETHDGFRGVKGAFKSVMIGAENCIKEGLSVQINVTVTKNNYQEVFKILEIAERIRVNSIHVFHFVPVGRGTEISQLEIPVNEYAELLAKIYLYQDKTNVLVKPTCAPHYWIYLLERRPSFFSEFLEKYPRGCIAGLSYAYISPIGDVTPCPYLPVKAGNIRNKSFSEIWRNSEVLNELRNRLNLKGRCRGCSYKEICGGCRARAYVYYGDYLAEDPACIFTN